MALAIKATERTTGTRGELNQLRKQGSIPGVVYGKNLTKPLSIAVEEKELLHMLRSHPNAVIELDVTGGGKQPVMMTEVQRDPLSRTVLHIDFHQINMNEEVKTAVRLDVTGESPGVKEGGILQVMLHELEVQCLPNKIPESVDVDISSLAVGENVLVGDLKLPEGVTSRVDGENVVVAVLAPQKELSEEEAEDAAVEANEASERAEEAQRDEVDKE
ncbi:50S ribosomal protein L25/general stress protein Ctc [Paenibacillus mendelii]|uniref:Large ribosomal subunit protein bL25 n=1 Tax=Paenibacillus mendelii TaxID=206163 RepID=A0ABV6JIB1_9BACL|nr:50S ribosomal protein L25/general stress protein Ctc [Paenibacillus mendelii]MCQ6563729.1 50S ribosomal protein L25/general stress protein Ctc [Paenibacillus mendelii]